eukprot:Selendium_serpulae@DN5408_c0_g1_i1.p1
MCRGRSATFSAAVRRIGTAPQGVGRCPARRGEVEPPKGGTATGGHAAQRLVQAQPPGGELVGLPRSGTRRLRLNSGPADDEAVRDAARLCGCSSSSSLRQPCPRVRRGSPVAAESAAESPSVHQF